MLWIAQPVCVQRELNARKSVAEIRVTSTGRLSGPTMPCTNFAGIASFKSATLTVVLDGDVMPFVGANGAVVGSQDCNSGSTILAIVAPPTVFATLVRNSRRDVLTRVRR